MTIRPLRRAITDKMSNASRVPISALPLPSQSYTLTKNLTPDPLTPSPALFHDLRREKPSLQRRARLLDAEAHFSYVAPFPSAFPFRITPPEGEEEIDKAALIEKWLSAREALQERPEQQTGSVLKKYYPDEKEVGDRPVKLIGLSETGLRDCLPRLDVGDAFALLGTPSLLPSAQEEVVVTVQDNAARQELIEVLSGSVVLANEDVDPERSWAPWSLRYSGHQFGVWAGQLGDGRAISLRKYIVRIAQRMISTEFALCSRNPPPLGSRAHV